METLRKTRKNYVETVTKTMKKVHTNTKKNKEKIT